MAPVMTIMSNVQSAGRSKTMSPVMCPLYKKEHSMKLKAIELIDFYKSGHIFQYPKGTTAVYSNFTPRSDRLAAHVSQAWDHKVVFVGLQGVIQWLLIDLFNDTFFKVPKEEAVGSYQELMDECLGAGAVPVDHIAALHDLGYLPVRIKAIPEGSRVNMGVPVYTIVNTKPEFFWLTNYLETMLSAESWKVITNATVAYEYRRLLEHYAELTGAPMAFVDWQGHDFSMRGMGGVYDAAQNGSGHSASFLGTDTVPVVRYLKQYYGATFVGGSVPATEHSVMCMGGNETEVETFRRLIEDVYPSGIVSIVSDTWDFWKVITDYAVQLKDKILARTPNALGMAKVVFRPDSGDPVKILTGYTSNEAVLAENGRYYELDPMGVVSSNELSEAEVKGAVECLWDIFGGTTTEKGFKVLHERVGLIYGDSITLDRAKQIMERLAAKGFASCNCVFGIGSYTYQYNTRDTYGMAMKATWGVVDGVARELFKDPVTDNGTKKSARGLLRVEKEGNNFKLYDQQTHEQEVQGALETVFENGKLVKFQKWDDIKARLAASK